MGERMGSASGRENRGGDKFGGERDRGRRATPAGRRRPGDGPEGGRSTAVDVCG